MSALFIRRVIYALVHLLLSGFHHWAAGSRRNGLGLTALLSSHSFGNRDVWDSPHQQINPLTV